MHLLYPDRRTMSASEIMAWAGDVWEDSAPRTKCCGCGRITVKIKFGQPEAEVRPGEYRADDPNHPCMCQDNWVPVHEPDQERPHGLDACADYLEDLGLATFKRG